MVTRDLGQQSHPLPPLLLRPVTTTHNLLDHSDQGVVVPGDQLLYHSIIVAAHTAQQSQHCAAVSCSLHPPLHQSLQTLQSSVSSNMSSDVVTGQTHLQHLLQSLLAHCRALLQTRAQLTPEDDVERVEHQLSQLHQPGPDDSVVAGVEGAVQHLVTESLDTVQVLEQLYLVGGVLVSVAWQTSQLGDAAVVVEQHLGLVLQTPDQRGEKEHCTVVCHLQPVKII